MALVANVNSVASCTDKMPGSENESVTSAVVRACITDHPGGFLNDIKGSGLGWFSYKDGDACVLKKARDTRNQRAAGMIAAACRCLYTESKFDDEACAYRQLPPGTTFSPPG